MASVAALAQELGCSWHTANRLAGDPLMLAEWRLRKAAAGVIQSGREATHDVQPAGDCADTRHAAVAPSPGVGPGVAPAPEPARGGLVHAARPYERVAFLTDPHHPHHDERAIDAVFAFLADWKPDLLIWGGDWVDCYGISSYDKDPERECRLQSEFDSTRGTVERTASLACDVAFLLGNHDHRINRLIVANPGLSRLRALEYRRAAELPDSWLVLPSQTHYKLGSLIFLHGDLAGRGGGAKHIASNMLDKLRTSCMMGHYHRCNVHHATGYDGTPRAAFSVGHLSDASRADYVTAPDWQQAFATVEFDHAAGLFHADLHLIHRGRFHANGRTYTG